MLLDLDAVFNPERGRVTARPAITPIRAADLPPDWQFEWDERAAILEFEGGLPRERAEAFALRDVVARMRGSAGRARDRQKERFE